MRGGLIGMAAAERRLLPEGRLSGPMPWVIAIMMFLTLLAAAAGLGLDHSARTLGDRIGGRVTVQVIEANPDLREAAARSALARLKRMEGVRDVRRVDEAEMARLLAPWLGKIGAGADLPIPAMIEADITSPARMEPVRAAMEAIGPAVRVDDSAQWLALLAELIDALKLLALGLVLLMAAATGATVVLAARAALDTHRATIEVLHLMGATDVQVARLFQRRIALDALFGGLVGLIAADGVLLLIGRKVGAVGSELLGSAALPSETWLILALLPIGGVLLAMLVARATILRALGRLL